MLSGKPNLNFSVPAGREEKKIIKLFEIVLIGDAMFVRKSNEP